MTPLPLLTLLLSGGCRYHAAGVALAGSWCVISGEVKLGAACETGGASSQAGGGSSRREDHPVSVLVGEAWSSNPRAVGLNALVQTGAGEVVPAGRVLGCGVDGEVGVGWPSG